MIAQYKFSDKAMTIGTHIHHLSIPIPFLLFYYLFCDNFEKVNTDTVKRTKKTRLINIWSNECTLSIFSIENKNAVRFMKGDKLYYGCRKIVLVFTNNDDYDGGINVYILVEKRRKWQVNTSNNFELLVTPPTFRRLVNPNTNLRLIVGNLLNQIHISSLSSL